VFAPFLGTCDVLLEIGPGGGRFTEILVPKCRKLIAVDTSEAMLALLRERFGDDGRIDYRLGDGLGLAGVEDESVDAAFSYGVFVHLQHWDIYNYLVELQRVLRPGGKAIIQHSNTFSDLGWALFLKHVPRQLNKHKFPFTFTVNTPELMQELVRRSGLEPVESVTDIVKRDCITLVHKPAGREASG
jgi:ubiquinone/menaquinone biosynthesis C-methylase UbiE